MEKSRVQQPCLAPLFVGIIWCLMLESEWKYKFIGSSVWEIWIQIRTGKKHNFPVFSDDNCICATTKVQIEMQGTFMFWYLDQSYWKKNYISKIPYLASLKSKVIYGKVGTTGQRQHLDCCNSTGKCFYFYFMKGPQLCN